MSSVLDSRSANCRGVRSGAWLGYEGKCVMWRGLFCVGRWFVSEGGVEGKRVEGRGKVRFCLLCRGRLLMVLLPWGVVGWKWKKWREW